MEFLKQILENANIEEGVLDVESVIKQINAEIPKHFVPKEQYNSKAAELKTANSTMEELKKSGADNEELQKKITGYESEIKSLKTAAENTQKTYVLKDKQKQQV